MVTLLVGAATGGTYSGGTGTAEDPYRVATPQDLNDIGNHENDWDKHFILVNDVNLAEYTGTQFNRIGTDRNNAFTGVFDGNDHKIWNFTWDSNGINYVGLFKYVGANGQIKNLGMENVDVNAVEGKRIGGLVGFTEEGTIINCYSVGSVTGSAVVGGLVGENSGSIIACYSTSTISGISDCSGGLVGFNYSGTISCCYSSGNVSNQYDDAGGLVGENWLGTIANCCSSASVSSDEGTGGLVGGNAEGTITNCYSTGRVSGGSGGGGLVGFGGSVVNSFWDIETSGCNTSDGGTGETTAEMKTKSTFTDAGWDFVEIWDMGENQTYPFLLTEPAGDSSHDGKVNLIDLAILASHWLEERK